MNMPNPPTSLHRTWVHWFKTVASIESLKKELDAVDRLLLEQRNYPYYSRNEIKQYIKKKILLQSKIRILEGGINNE